MIDPPLTRASTSSREESADTTQAGVESRPDDRSYSPRQRRSRSHERSLSPHSKRRRLRSTSRQRGSSRHEDTADDSYRRQRRQLSPSPRRHRRSSSQRRRSHSPKRRYKGTRVYVGNLSYDCRRDDLKEFAREAGTVLSADVLVTPGGKSKGCGVVEYSRPEYAERAIRVLNRVDFMGRPVFVREDREVEPKTPKDPRDAPEDQKLFVGNLSFSTSWQDLKDLFRKAGRVTHTDIDMDPETRRSKGSGLVIFDDPRDAATAIEMFDGFEFRNRKLQVCEERNAPPLPPPKTTDVEHNDHRPRSNATSSYENAPPPPAQFMPSSIDLVGGPDAALPSHGPNQIFVNNLPYSTTWEDLVDLFRHVGPVVRAEILMANGYPKGSGLVRFEEFGTCERAIVKFNGYLYGGRHLDVRLDKFSMPA